VRELKHAITTEFNIEGNPKEDKFVDLVLEVKPTQVTLVPDELGQLTSNHGWDTIAEQNYLREMVSVFKNAGIRVSLFVDPIEALVAAASATGTDRIELYTEAFAKQYQTDPLAAVTPYVIAANAATRYKLGINAGHDLDLNNLKYFHASVPDLLEVSIGHALVCDALYFGLENTVQMYRRALQ
jgi:pyridoxine 5-phosphate synthase